MPETGETESAVVASIARLRLVLHSLEERLASERARADRDADHAATNYIGVLSAVLASLKRTLVLYAAKDDTPLDDRKAGLETIDAGADFLLRHLGEIEYRMSPRHVPLVAAYEHVLDRLLPNHAAVFHSISEINYELDSYECDSFGDYLQEDPVGIRWPLLFLRVPSSPIDSPRHHVLLAHEIGHAIAAVTRHFVVHSPDPHPASLPKFDPSFVCEPATVDAIARQRLSESGRPLEQSAIVPKEATLDAAASLQSVTLGWLEEVYGDAIGCCLFGPAFLLAFIEVFPPIRDLAAATMGHPPDALRLSVIARVLSDPRLGHRKAQLPLPVRQRILSALELARRAFPSVPGSQPSESERLLLKAACDAVAAQWKSLLDNAFSTTKDLLYTGKQLRIDIARHSDALSEFGIPPIGDKPQEPLSLASIMNVAHAVAATIPQDLEPAEGLSRARRLDDLILKAIESAEIQRLWTEMAVDQ